MSQTLPRSSRRRAFKIVIVAAVIGVLAVLVFVATPDAGVNVPPDRVKMIPLPPEATHVNYCRRGLASAHDCVEFDVPEAVFLAWAKRFEGGVRPFDRPENPVLIRRFGVAEKAGGPEFVEVTRGYGWGHSTDPEGNGIRTELTYDAVTGRAYYFVIYQ